MPTPKCVNPGGHVLFVQCCDVSCTGRMISYRGVLATSICKASIDFSDIPAPFLFWYRPLSPSTAAANNTLSVQGDFHSIPPAETIAGVCHIDFKGHCFGQTAAFRIRQPTHTCECKGLLPTLSLVAKTTGDIPSHV